MDLPPTPHRSHTPPRALRRGVVSPALVAGVVALTATGMPDVAVAAPDCAWAADVSERFRDIDEAGDPRTDELRERLLELGFGRDGSVPPECADGPESGSAVPPLTGVALKGIFTPGETTGRTIEVAGGGSAIADAAPEPGDVVEIAAGTYDGFTPRSGGPGNYVTYRASRKGTVVVTGAGSGSEDGGATIDLSGSSFVHLDGLTVADAPAHGVFGDGASDIALTGIEIATSQDGGIVFNNSTNIHIEGCDIHGSNARGTDASNEALSIAVGTRNFEIFNCTVRGNGEEGIDVKYDSTDGVVHHNAVWGNRGPNIYVDAAQGVDVINNWSWGATGPGKPGIMLAVEDFSDSGLIADIDVRANTVFDNRGGNVVCWEEGGTADGAATWTDVTVRGNQLVDDAEPVDCDAMGVEVTGNVDTPLDAAAQDVLTTVTGADRADGD